MADTVSVDLIVEAISKGFDRVSADLNKVSQTASKTGQAASDGFKQGKTSAEQLKTSVMGVLTVVGTVGTAVFALKKVWDFAKQGAELEFYRDKFDRLAESIGTTGEALFKSLKNATSGMMSDSQIIASAVDLIALGLVNTHEQAVRLVTVAAKLHMPMNQLVLALTNMTTMRFDQLGVRVEGFEERVKSLEATGMDAAQAFREAFLQQAEEQIKLAGDAAETSVAKFARMEAALGNVGDAAKMKLAPGLSDAAEALATLLTWQEQIAVALEEHAKATFDAAGGYEAYREEMERGTRAARYWIDAAGNVYRSWGDMIEGPKKAIPALKIMTAEEYAASKAAEVEAAKVVEVAAAHTKAAEAVNKQHDAQQRLERLASRRQERQPGLDYAEALNVRGIEVAKRAAQELALVNTGLAAGLRGELKNASEEYATTIASINEKHATLLVDLEEARRRYGKGSEQVRAIKEEIAGLAGAETEAAAALKLATEQMIYQQAAAGLDASASLELARSMGLISEADYAVATTIQNLRAQYDKNADGLITSSEKAGEFAGQIETLNTVIADLEKQNMPITAKSIAEGMEAISKVALGPLAEDNMLQGIQDQKEPTVTALSDVNREAETIGTTITTMVQTAGGDFDAIKTKADETQAELAKVTAEALLIQQAIEEIPTEKIVTITINTVETGGGGGGGSGGGSKRQHGGDFIVPPGYPHDTFPVWTTSGERVVVMTRQQQSVASGGGVIQSRGGGGNYIEGDNFFVTNIGRQAAAVSMANLSLIRRRRLNASMG